MPELARFYGIVITMLFRDHGPPHIHAYGGNRRRPDWAAQFAIHDGGVLDGEVDGLARCLVKDWIRLHRSELLNAWALAVAGRQPGKIAPLKFR